MVTIYVEGGGRDSALKRECRQGFSKLMRRANPRIPLPSVVACGPRNVAFEKFRTALGQLPSDHFVILLVDSEIAVAGKRWPHLKKQDKWIQPTAAGENHVHLMIQCMETWLIADEKCLTDYFGHVFKGDKLPRNPKLESVGKSEILIKLKAATRNSRPKGEYDKARDSFDLLGRIDPSKLKAACPSAKEFFNVLDNHCARS